MNNSEHKSPKTTDLFTGVSHAEKYQSNNWIARKLVNDFMASILQTAKECGSKEFHEVGCGEGHIMGLLASNGFKIRGSDVSLDSLEVARLESQKRGYNFELSVKSVYDLSAEDACDAVICCEVLEHLVDPAAAMKKLIEAAKHNLIVSVPHEPIWHILNMSRGKYLTALGNTPGHFQHWSRKQFVDFVSEYADIVSVKNPLPWTLVHCRPKRRKQDV